MQRYPDEILILLTDKGFDKEYEKCISKFPSKTEAYEAVEQTVYKYFKIRRYTCFDSFRHCWSRRLKGQYKTDVKKKKRI